MGVYVGGCLLSSITTLMPFPGLFLCDLLWKDMKDPWYSLIFGNFGDTEESIRALKLVSGDLLGRPGTWHPVHTSIGSYGSHVILMFVCLIDDAIQFVTYWELIFLIFPATRKTSTIHHCYVMEFLVYF